MCCHPAFVALFIEYKPSRFSINSKGPGILGIINDEHELHQEVTSCIESLILCQRFFQALKPGIAFSFLAMKVLDGNFFKYNLVLSTLKICLVQPPLLIILGLLDNLAVASALAALPYPFMLWRLLLKPHEPASASLKLFFCMFLTSLQPLQN